MHACDWSLRGYDNMRYGSLVPMPGIRGSIQMMYRNKFYPFFQALPSRRQHKT
ncbi:hypothetical protein SAMN05660653_01658 [Desulfonatronum thiosulfatophilum]|uniref:Uncharacterized protein n=1 Tax=Desulfonatronum thiosulfatophilum TaxID=617002 RepID=A0A1G6CNF5_9BACT|nr:hypothetical protein SAMN05660653_01658 [Desulfonatronum thiosulfatophilum]